MLAVDVSVSHNDNAVVAQLFRRQAFGNTHPQSNDQILNFGKFENFVQTGSFGVENFAPERKNSLEFAVPALFRASARTVAFDYIDFRFRRVSGLAVGQFTRS